MYYRANYRFWTIEDQRSLQAQAYSKIGIAWFLGAFALWLFENQHAAVLGLWYAYWGFVIAIKLLGLSGWCDLGRSKGHGWWVVLLALIPVAGPLLIVFLDDKWFEQRIPKLRVKKRMSW